LLQVAGQTFKHIIIDSPPVASFTDGVLMASYVDGVLLVVHGGKTSRQVAKRTRQMLVDVGAKIIGVVLNKVSVDSQDYYYHRHYGSEVYNYQTPPPDNQAMVSTVSKRM